MKIKSFDCKKMLTGISILSLLLTSTTYAQQNAVVNVNGKPINGQAIIVDNSVYVPVRAVSDSLGADVNWNNNTKVVNITQTSSSGEAGNISAAVNSINPAVVGIVGTYDSSAEVSYQSAYLDGVAHGTGVIIGENGKILTNAHVVKGLRSILVVMHNGDVYEGKLEAIDEFSDLATVKINATGLTVAKFANSNSIYTGQSVLAVGNPISLSFRNTVSHGIISGLNRGMGSNYRLIHTDAAINPGNSGGPLINMNGEVVGINSNKYVGTSIEGMGFAIPIDTVNYVLNHFSSYGKVIRGSIGATFNEGAVSKLGIVSNAGITIIKFDDNSPLANAGARTGDKIIAIDNIPINSIVDYNEAMKNYMPDNTISVKVKSGTDEKTLTVKIK